MSYEDRHFPERDELEQDREALREEMRRWRERENDAWTRWSSERFRDPRDDG